MENRYLMIKSTRKEWNDKRIARVKCLYPDATVISSKSVCENGSDSYIPYLLKNTSRGTQIIFDEFSNLGVDDENRIKNYRKFVESGIHITFINEPILSSSNLLKTYCLFTEAETLSDVDVDTFMNLVRKSVSEYLKAKEMESLGRKAMQGITIENGGNPVGRPAGTTLETKKAEESKQKILRLSADFDGYMHDQELIKYLGISRNSFYKYKADLKKQCPKDTKLNFHLDTL